MDTTEVMFALLFLAGIGLFSYGMFLYQKHKRNKEKNDREIFIHLGIGVSSASALFFAIFWYARIKRTNEDQSNQNQN